MPPNGSLRDETVASLPLAERVTLQYQVEQFLYDEAELLDQRRYSEWYELFSEEIHYWMPIRRTTQAKETHLEFTARGGMAFFDDDHTSLTQRVDRLYVGRAWAEDPPSRTRHTVSNVRILNIEGPNVTVGCNFHLYRTRLDSEEDIWIGRREDVVRSVDDRWLLAQRHVFLDQTVILSQNLSSFF